MRLRINPQALAALPAVQRREIQEQLRELERAIVSNPLLRYNNPLFSRKIHEKQLVFHASRDPLKLFIGGNRAGKRPPVSSTI